MARPNHYMSDSLFNEQSITLSDVDLSVVTDCYDNAAYEPNMYRERFTEAYALGKYDSLWFDYIYCAQKPELDYDQDEGWCLF